MHLLAAENHFKFLKPRAACTGYAAEALPSSANGAPPLTVQIGEREGHSTQNICGSGSEGCSPGINLSGYPERSKWLMCYGEEDEAIGIFTRMIR